MKNAVIIVILAVFVFAGFASAEDWPRFRKDNLNSGESAELVQPPLSVKWTFKCADKIVSSPTVKAGRVYAGCRDNNLYCLDEATGQMLWKYETSGWVDAAAAVNGDKVYFSSRDGYLYCLNAETGGLVWKYKTGGTDCASPLVADGKVFCGSAFPNKFIYALNADSGQELWKTEVMQMVYSSPAYFDGNIYIGANDGHIYCLDKDSGIVKWKYHTKGGVFFASPAIAGEKVFFAPGNFNWQVYAFSLDTGVVLWQYEIEDKQATPNYVSTIAARNDALFVVCGYANQYLYCLNPANGNLKWKAALGPATRFGFSASACVSEDTVYASSAQGILNAYEIASGRLVGNYDLGAMVLSSPALSNGVLYIGTLDGILYALE